MMMSNAHRSRHHVQRIAGAADRVECAAMLGSQAIADTGLNDERVAGAMDDFDVDILDINLADWEKEDLANENAIGGTLEIITDRAKCMGDAYPFRVDNGLVTYLGSESKVYEFCLHASISDLSSDDNRKLTSIFEKISSVLVASYMGEHGCHINTGWPREDRTKFEEVMRELHEQTGEWSWGPNPEVSSRSATQHVKDEGMDFVAWRPSPDGRKGHLFLVGQCACGGNWENKFHDLDLGRIGKWFNPISLVSPVRVFCTPFHVTNGLLYASCTEAGIVFDRLRLSILAKNAPMGIVRKLRNFGLASYLFVSPDIGQGAGHSGK